MAATALVATADGVVTFSELSALDNILVTVQDLQMYDPHVAVNRYRDFADALGENPADGRATAIAAVSKIAGDRDAAELVVRVAAAISKADGDFSPEEAQVVSELCDVLGIDMPDEDENTTSA
jgi:tellurite resistance protein TerB